MIFNELHGRRGAVCLVTVGACVPYLVLKVMWLAGSSAGATSAAAASELGDTRHVVGDVITVAMELAVVALALALATGRGRALPSWVVLAPVWLATGLLVPLVTGLPAGLVAQAVVGGAPAPDDNGLQGWVFLLVYGGFIVQAVGIGVLFVGYVRDRWPVAPCPAPVATPRRRQLAEATVGVTFAYAALNVAWAFLGTRAGGPGGFDTVMQRSVLVTSGLCVAAGAVGVRQLVTGRRGWWSILLAWTGTAVTVASGPTEVALAHDARPSVPLIAAAIVATSAGLLLTVLLVRGYAGQATAELPNHPFGPTVAWADEWSARTTRHEQRQTYSSRKRTLRDLGHRCDAPSLIGTTHSDGSSAHVDGAGLSRTRTGSASASRQAPLAARVVAVYVGRASLSNGAASRCGCVGDRPAGPASAD